MSDSSSSIYGDKYLGPAYKITKSVYDLRRVPRFGYNNDITTFLSSDQDAQASYATGLVALFVFILLFFVFWIVIILVFKCMGPGNAGFLSGHHFVIPDRAEDENNIYKRPFRVRLTFLLAASILMVFSLLFVTMGLTNVDNTVTTVSLSLRQLGKLVTSTELIAGELEKVGDNSIVIRDEAVNELENICPNNPNLDEVTGLNVMEIASQAKEDLTMLSNFIKDGLRILAVNLGRVRSWTSDIDTALPQVEFWGWQFKLLSAWLFMLPAFLVMGVGLVIVGVDIKCYQNLLTYFVMPLFSVVIFACCIVCAAILPVSATMADTCIGGGEAYGGPDDTVLTVFRNFRGNDSSILFLIVAYYTQRCRSEYYPYGILSKYLGDLDGAIESTDTVLDTVQNNLDLLLQQCGRSYDSVVKLVKDMNINLQILRKQADRSLELVQCKNINDIYVNTVHKATCTYSVSALAWIFASSLIISVCGLIIIMLRSAYLSEEFLELSDRWIKSPPSTMSETASIPVKFMDNSECNSAQPLKPASPKSREPVHVMRSCSYDEYHYNEPVAL